MCILCEEKERQRSVDNALDVSVTNLHQLKKKRKEKEKKKRKADILSLPNNTTQERID